MRAGIYPGSFDPLTYGHLDIIERASVLFDRFIVAVFDDEERDFLFTLSERMEMLKSLTKKFPNVEVTHFSGLLVDHAAQQGATTIVRGLRAVSDFEYEFQMALMNKKLNPLIETIFMMTNENHLYLSSSIVKEIAKLRGCINKLVPPLVEERLKEKFSNLTK